MDEDGSRHEILVTKVFPREALSAKAWVMDAEEGKTVILVKPEYASLAYFGLREATIHWFETRKILERKQDEVKESEKTFKALTMWINGDKFEETVRHIDNAKKAAEGTRNHLVSMRSYFITHIEKGIKFQDSIELSLTHAKSTVEKLRNLLNS